jgi:LmbE family N-acetylglucosaminyl deacetylase
MPPPAPSRTEPANAVFTALAGRDPLSTPLLVVVAHPDDETIALGGQMRRLRTALLVHITDGAPRDGEDARRHGFAVPADYAAARECELAAALAVGEATELRRVALGVPDKEAYLGLAALSRRLAELIERERPVAILTHPYEGGHPDHDAAAFAVHAACRLVGPWAPAAIVEMAFYHARGGGMVTGAFLPGGDQEAAVALTAPDLARKRQMVACFQTQSQILAGFELSPERFRPAPAYDFRQPPHAGVLLYETWGWGIDGAQWRRRAAEALAVLRL